MTVRIRCQHDEPSDQCRCSPTHLFAATHSKNLPIIKTYRAHKAILVSRSPADGIQGRSTHSSGAEECCGICDWRGECHSQCGKSPGGILCESQRETAAKCVWSRFHGAIIAGSYRLDWYFSWAHSVVQTICCHNLAGQKDL